MKKTFTLNKSIRDIRQFASALIKQPALLSSFFLDSFQLDKTQTNMNNLNTSKISANSFSYQRYISILVFVIFSSFRLLGQTVEVNPCTGVTMGDAINEIVTNNVPNQTILVDSYFFTSQSEGGNWGLASLVATATTNLDGLTIDFQDAYIASSAASLGVFDISGIDNVTFKNVTLDGFNRSLGSFVVNNCEGTIFENVNFVNSPETQPMVFDASSGNTSATFINCSFSGNPTTSSSTSNATNTGAVLLEGHASNTLNVSFQGTSFSCNGRDVDGGGAVQINGDEDNSRTGTTVSFTNCDFSNNNVSSAGSGGGAISASTEVTLNITGCTFYNNKVAASSGLSSGGGGAIMLNGKTTMTISNSFFLDNSSIGGSSDGGAIATNAGGSGSRNTVTISGSSFVGNSCTDEGGACFFRHADVTMTNSLFINNNSPDGGAFHIENAGIYNLDGVTITGTTGGEGHGIENNSGTLTLNNSIIVGNSGTNVPSSASVSNSTTSGSVVFNNPMPSGETNPATYDYDVTGTQGSTLGILADVTSSTDCPAIATAPPAVSPCESIVVTCDANAGALPTDPTGCQEITDMPDGTTSIQMLSYGFNNTADYTQAYFIVNADGTIAEVIEVVGDDSATPAAVTSGLNTYEDGTYKIYVINYKTDDATVPDFSTFTSETDITNLSLTSTYTSGACMVMAENSPMAITICDPACGCDDNTDSGTLTTLTAVPGSYNPNYNQTYLITNTAGLILDIQSSATFANLPAGDYMVYAINSSLNPTEDPFVDNSPNWTAITANTTTIANLLDASDIGQACFMLSTANNYTVGSCPSVAPIGDDVCLGSTTTVDGMPTSGSGTYTTHAWTISDGIVAGTAMNITLTNADAQVVTVDASGATATAGTAILTYTVTDDEGCMDTDILIITITPEVTPTFAAVGPYCAGATIPALPTTSMNSITGTWSPALDNTTTTTYTFTPNDASQCGVSTTLEIEITPEVTPTFAAVGPYCAGATIPALPTTSMNSITGTWSPALDNTTTTTYTFTPNDASQCGVSTTLEIEITPEVTPTFAAVGPYCAGATIPALPTTSMNSITGTWSPALDNTTTTTYTFTPNDASQCGVSTTLEIEITPEVTPTFAAVGPYCAGATIPALPTTSMNSITGTWSPALDNTTTTTYTFTPNDASQCGVSTTLEIEITPEVTPTFAAVGPYCAGATIPALPTTSMNSITGTWSPALDNTTTTTYTFTPNDASQCGVSTTLEIEITPEVTPTFAAVGPYCAGATIPALPTTSMNSITGTWSPALDNTTTTTYTFTPNDASQCGVSTTLEIEITPEVTPTFAAVGPYCAGATIPALPTTSMNSITGTWSPALDNTTTTTYTFTPNDASQCGVSTTLEIEITPEVTPTFAAVGPYCAGATIPALPTTSMNSITGTWSPALDNTTTTTYTFTPNDASQCGVSTTLEIEITPEVTPTFAAVGPYCAGATIPALPTTSMNSITGTWSPALDNTTTTTYTFTPNDASQCGVSTTLEIEITPEVTPTFAAVGPYCAGATIPALPTTSMNSITGTWSPALDNTTTTTYTFTPNDASQCGVSTTLEIEITPEVTPTFAAVGPYCAGATIPALPTTSMNSITGTWSPALDNTTTTTYTFTPNDASQCGVSTTLEIEITPEVTPTFAAVGPYCAGATIPALPTTSMNSITGTWSPALDNTTTTTYTFTPNDASQCGVSTTLEIEITPEVTPTFAAVGPYCAGATIPALPTTSMNSITGTWSPALDNTTTTTYTFTPNDASQCGVSTTLEIEITPEVTPTFAAVGPYCAGATIPALPTTSMNSITGTWSPALDNTTTTTYTFTPNDASQCGVSTTLEIEITPEVTPTFAAVGPYCAGATIPALPTTSMNSITGTWSPALDNTTTTTYTFTPNDASQCGVSTTLEIEINDIPVITTTTANPTTCTGTEGTITINGLTPSTAYILNYNTITQNIVSLSDGTYIISGLAAGAYNGITVTLNDCVSNIEAETLADPSAPDGSLAVSNVEACNPLSENIEFIITSSEPAVLYQLQNADGSPLIPAVNAFGNGGDLTLTINQLNAPSATTTYQIVATHFTTGCTTVLANQPTFTLNQTPEIMEVLSSCDGDGGTLTILASDPSGTGTLLYSIDGGMNYETFSVFNELPNGPYNVAVRIQETGCTAFFSDNLISCTPAISVIKTAGNAADNTTLNISSGDNVTYTYVIENTGEIDLALTSISDNPHGDVLANGTLTNGDIDADNILDIDETWTYTLLVNNITEDVTNIVDVVGNPVTEDGTDLASNDNVADTDNAVVLVEDPAIALVKGSSIDLGADGTASVGDIITYSYTATNTGNVTLDNVSITENALNFTGTGTLPTPVFMSSTMSSLEGTLLVGESATYTASYAITQMDIDAGSVENQATATGESPMDTMVSDDSDSTNPADETGGEEDPTVQPIAEDPAIALVKGSSIDLGADGTASVGDIITYTYTATNTGNVTLDNVSITENVLNFTGTGTLPTPVFMSSTMSSLEGTLLIGESATYTASYAITQMDIDAGSVENQATATGESPMDTMVSDDSDSTNPADETGGEEDPTVQPIAEDPAIALVKGSSIDLGADGTASVGDIITYTYTATNTGNVTLDNVSITENVLNFTGTGTLPTPVFMSSTMSSLEGTLLVGESATYTASYAITQMDIDAGSVENQATATGESPMDTMVSDDSDSTNPADETGGEEDPTVQPIAEDPAIALVKGSSIDLGADGTASVGDIITYTYTATNTGNVTLDNVSITENALNFTGTGTLPTPVFMSSTMSSLEGTLLVGESATYTASYAITQMDIDAGSVENQATATGESPMDTMVSDDSDSTNPADETGGEEDPTVQPIAEDPAIALVKGSSIDLGADGTASVGDIITYSYTATNTGNVTLDNVSITENALNFTGTGTLPTPVFMSSTMSSLEGTLLVGESATYTASYAITQMDIDAGSVENQATATGESPMDTMVSDDSDSTNPADETGGEEDPTVQPIAEDPAIALVKGSSIDLGADGTASVGDIITYTYTATNTGNVTLDNVSITENALNFTGTGTLPTPVFMSSTMSSLEGTLLVGESATYTASYAITQMDIDAGSVENQATATGESPMDTMVSDDSDSTNPADETGGEEDPTVQPIAEDPAIALVKGSSIDLGADGTASVGDIITYTYTATNTGNVTLDNVSITENALNFTGTGTLPTPVFMSSTMSSLEGTLLVGESATYTASYAITQMDIDAGSVENQATATGESPMDTMVSDDSDSTNPADETGGEEDPTVQPIAEDPAIALVKGSSIDLGADGTASVGDIITYTYTATNTGNVTLDNVSITENALNFTGTGTLPTPVFMSSTMSSLEGTLLIGESATYTASYAITQMDIDAGSVENQATATGESPMDTMVSDDSDSTNPADETGGEEDPTVQPIAEDPAIALVKGSSIDLGADGTASVGDIITYTYTATNTGNVTLDNVSITENVLNFTGTGTLPTPVFMSSTMSSLEGTLLIGESATYTASYAITQMDIDAGSVENQATATGESPMDTMVSDDSDSTNPADETGGEEDPTVQPIAEDPAIALVKGSELDLGADAAGTIGDIITYTYTATNIGNVILDNVTIDENAIDFSGTGTLPTPVFDSSTEGSAEGTLLVGESATYTATYAITQLDIDARQVDNRATVTGESPMDTMVSDDSDSSNPNDPNETGTPGNPDEDDPTGQPLPFPVLLADKISTFDDADGDGQLGYGEVITYSIVLSHTDASMGAAAGLRFSDAVPMGTTLVGNSVDVIYSGAGTETIISGNAETDTEVSIILGELPLGETITISFDITVDVGTTGGIANLATFTADNHPDVDTDDPEDPTNDPENPEDPTDPTYDPISVPDLLADKTSTFDDANGDGQLGYGEEITYSLIVMHTENSTGIATNLVLNDPIPAGATLTANSVNVIYSNGADEEVINTGNAIGDTDVNVTLGNLPLGETITVTFTVTVDEGATGAIENVGTFTPTNHPPVDTDDPTDPTNDPDDSTDPIDPTFDPIQVPMLIADKSSSFVDVNGDNQLGQNEQIDYTIILTHTAASTGTATDIIMNDPIPSNTTLVPNTVTVVYSGIGSEMINTGNAETDTNVNVSLGDLPVGETVTITFSVIVNLDAVGTVENVAIFTPTNHPDVPTDDPNDPTNDPENPGDPIDPTIDPISSPILLADKTSSIVDANGDNSLNVGEQLDYSITLFHTASSTGDATGVIFDDLVPENTTLVANSVAVVYSGVGTETVNTGNATTDIAVNIDLGDLPLGETVTVTFSVIVNLDANGTIENQAVFTPTNHPDVPTDDPTDPTNDPEEPGDPTDPTEDPIICDEIVVCNDFINVSLDEDCEALITPDMIAEGEDLADYQYTVEIFTVTGESLGNTADASFVNQVFTVQLTSNCSGNSCWGQILVEDKLAPTVECADITIDCSQVLAAVAEPIATDGCGIVSLELIGESINTVDQCDTGVTITREYIAIDLQGNISEPCTQTITIEQLNEVSFPEDIAWTCAQYADNNNIIDANPLSASCDMVELTNNDDVISGLLDGTQMDAACLAATGSGVPSVAQGEYCAFVVTHTDHIFEDCGNNPDDNLFKILRVWTALNWCTGEVVTIGANGEDNAQIIKIADVDAPNITISNQIVNANISDEGECTSRGALAIPTITDDCSDDVTWTVFTPVGEANFENGQYYIPFPGLAMGTYDINYIATDGCGNTSNVTVQLEVVDGVGPTPVCDEVTQVAIGTDGTAVVFAETFDDGSTDNCGIEKFEVRRMAGSCANAGDNDSEFDTNVHFCCEDIGNTTQVILRVYDFFGNTNDCMVEVLVEDKLDPTKLTDVEDASIDCDVYFDNYNIALDLAEADGDNNPQILLDLFGEPTYEDNCEAIVTASWTRNVNNCGIGTITRSWTVIDPSNNEGPSCSQTITVNHVNDWNIEFPEDIDFVCVPDMDELEGEMLGEPTVFDDDCELIAISIEDETFNVVEDACYQIIRTYTAINWCVFDGDNQNDDIEISENHFGDGGDGIVTYSQVIRVTDEVAPQITNSGEQSYCLDGLTDADGDCDLNLEIPIAIVTDCSPNITITYAVEGLVGTGRFYDDVEVGVYTVTVFATDDCGNQSTMEYDVTVTDCKAPTPYCVGSLIAELMPMDTDGDGLSDSGMVELWATDFNVGSFDNCTAQEDLIFHVGTTDNIEDANPNGNIDFDCSDSGNNIVYLFVTDEAGYTDVCETSVYIESVQNACGNDTPIISGVLATEYDVALEGAMVSLNNGTTDVSNTEGAYELTVEASTDVTVAPMHDVYDNASVTTYDLVLIRQHILTTSLLNSPYKMIAADVNNNGAITGADLVMARQVILGLADSYNNNTAWVFVDRAHDFPSDWVLSDGYPAVVNINNISESHENVDFVAVRVGDVNGTFGFAEDADERTGLNILTDDVLLKKGEMHTVNLEAEAALIGYQFTLDFTGLDLISIDGAAENFGVFSNAITTSFEGDASDKMFALTFKATENIHLSEALAISSRITKSEGYNEEGTILGLELQFNNTEKEFALYQNTPNPFKEKTMIGFSLPSADYAKLTISDVSGKVVQIFEGNYEKGYNQIQINHLTAKGVLYYHLETANYSAVRKMVLLD